MANHPNRSMKRFYFDAAHNEINVWSGRVETRTFRCGPVFNNRLPPLGIETNSADDLIAHISQRVFPPLPASKAASVYIERIRNLIRNCQVGDVLTLPQLDD